MLGREGSGAAAGQTADGRRTLIYSPKDCDKQGTNGLVNPCSQGLAGMTHDGRQAAEEETAERAECFVMWG